MIRSEKREFQGLSRCQSPFHKHDAFLCGLSRTWHTCYEGRECDKLPGRKRTVLWVIFYWRKEGGLTSWPESLQSSFEQRISRLQTSLLTYLCFGFLLYYLVCCAVKRTVTSPPSHLLNKLTLKWCAESFDFNLFSNDNINKWSSNQTENGTEQLISSKEKIVGSIFWTCVKNCSGLERTQPQFQYSFWLVANTC